MFGDIKIMEYLGKKTAFTLAEVAIVFFIIAIVSLVTVKISNSKSGYELKAMYHATFMNLQKAVSLMLTDGCTSPDTEVCPAVKMLPKISHNDKNEGFCDRITQQFNTLGKIDCTLKASDGEDFNKIDPNFTTANGAKYFNFGADVINSSTCIGTLCIADSDAYSLYPPVGTFVDNSGNTRNNYWAGAKKVCEDDGKSLPNQSDLNTIYQNRGNIPGLDLSKSYWSSTVRDSYSAYSQYFYNGLQTFGSYSNTLRVRCVLPAFVAFTGYYDVFIDINGSRGNSSIKAPKAEVMEFWIFLDGTVLPVGEVGGVIDRNYLTANLRYNNNGVYVSILRGVSYKEAMCKGGKIRTSAPTDKYCDCPHDSTEGECKGPYEIDEKCSAANNTCEVIINRPGF